MTRPFVTALLIGTVLLPMTAAAPLVLAQETVSLDDLSALNQIGQEQRSRAWLLKAEAAKAEVNKALGAARRSPADAHVTGYTTEYYYVEGDIFAVYTQPLTVTDIVLQPGEQIAGEVHVGDSARWSLSLGSTGQGASARQHIYVKPSQPRLLTNLIIPTNQRTYMLELSSTKSFYMPSVRWRYQAGTTGIEALLTQTAASSAAASGTANQLGFANPQSLYFDYRFSRSSRKKSWRPSQVFDDGQKTYLVFSEDIQFRETPVLFGRDESGELALVNYRVNMPYYIVDGLMDEIVLKRGERSRDEIRITRRRSAG